MVKLSFPIFICKKLLSTPLVSPLLPLNSVNIVISGGTGSPGAVSIIIQSGHNPSISPQPVVLILFTMLFLSVSFYNRMLSSLVQDCK